MWSPHDPIPVEKTFDEFVTLQNGVQVSSLVGESPTFKNADYLFNQDRVIIELKEIQKDFGNDKNFLQKHDELVDKIERETSWWKRLRGMEPPPEYYHEVVRLFRPPLQRILKKANRQIKETKSELNLRDHQGLLMIVNDGFVSFPPALVRSIVDETLTHSYKSLDAWVYLNVNTYVDLPWSENAILPWISSYSCRATDELVHFVDDLGRCWRKFLETKIGPFDFSEEAPCGTVNWDEAVAVAPENRDQIYERKGWQSDETNSKKSGPDNQ